MNEGRGLRYKRGEAREHAGNEKKEREKSEKTKEMINMDRGILSTDHVLGESDRYHAIVCAARRHNRNRDKHRHAP